MILFLSCHNTNGDKTLPVVEKDSVSKHPFKIAPDVLVPKEIRDTLKKLSFVKEAGRYYDSISDKKEGVTFIMAMIDTVTNEIYPDAIYWTPEHSMILYRFKVNPLTKEIRLSDIETANWITLKEYDKLNARSK